MPPKNPRSTARWIPSRLTGPERHGQQDAHDQADRDDQEDWESRSRLYYIVSGRDDRPSRRKVGRIAWRTGTGRTRAVGRRTVRQQEGPPDAEISADSLQCCWIIRTGAAHACPLPRWPRCRRWRKPQKVNPTAQKSSRRGPRPTSRSAMARAELPAPVAEMREAILAAVQSGKIEELRHAYELNDLKPELGPEPVRRSCRHWKKVSGDGEGREVLAALRRDPGSGLRGAAARPGPGEQPPLHLAVFRRGAPAASSPRPAG